uniref:Ras-GAP domain-containing protein n=1 Tax=Arcella intermedia TaxID=1963864 RepID=A0A6B2KYT8_9EUKA
MVDVASTTGTSPIAVGSDPTWNFTLSTDILVPQLNAVNISLKLYKYEEDENLLVGDAETLLGNEISNQFLQELQNNQLETHNRHAETTSHYKEFEKSLVLNSKSGGITGNIKLNILLKKNLVLHPEIYQDFLSVMVSEGCLIIQLLAEVTNGRLDAKLTQCLLSVFGEHDEQKFVKTILIGHIKKGSGETSRGDIFRDDSFATDLIELFMKKHCQDYLESVLKDFLTELINTNLPCEICPSLLSNMDLLPENLKNLKFYLKKLVDSIFASTHALPRSIRKMFHSIRVTTQQHYPDHPKIYYSIVSCLLFLRFLTPALISPNSYFANEIQPFPVSAIRTITYLAKTLQALASLTGFSMKEPYMNILESFVEENKNAMIQFMEEIGLEEKTEESDDYKIKRNKEGEKKRRVKDPKLHLNLGALKQQEPQPHQTSRLFCYQSAYIYRRIRNDSLKITQLLEEKKSKLKIDFQTILERIDGQGRIFSHLAEEQVKIVVHDNVTKSAPSSERYTSSGSDNKKGRRASLRSIPSDTKPPPLPEKLKRKSDKNKFKFKELTPRRQKDNEEDNFAFSPRSSREKSTSKFRTYNKYENDEDDHIPEELSVSPEISRAQKYFHKLEIMKSDFAMKPNSPTSKKPKNPNQHARHIWKKTHTEPIEYESKHTRSSSDMMRGATNNHKSVKKDSESSTSEDTPHAKTASFYNTIPKKTPKTSATPEVSPRVHSPRTATRLNAKSDGGKPKSSKGTDKTPDIC